MEKERKREGKREGKQGSEGRGSEGRGSEGRGSEGKVSEGREEVHAREGRMEKERRKKEKGEEKEEMKMLRRLGSLDGQQHMTGNPPPSSPTSYQSILHEEDAIARHSLC